MKVAKSWLQELVDLKVPLGEVERLLPLRTIAIKDSTDQFIELDMKGYNRADLLSMRGVAYEVAAITDSKVAFAEEPAFQAETSGKLIVEIKNPDKSPLYYLVKIEALTIGPSPKEWVSKLTASGMRSVNNVTDITNLIMLEYGQPLHAFNAAVVKDQTVIVRTAKPGENLTTLDGKNRQLESGDILITDPEKILGLAGVMGGKDSEIPDSGTITILLEAAIFDPITLRQTATRLGLISEASKRFYHGLTQKRLLQALDAALKMYQSLGGKVTAISKVGHQEDQTKTILLKKSKVDSLIGVDIPFEQIEDYLKKLHFVIARTEGTKQSNQTWQVTPPYWRLDIEIEEDLIEEVARMYGYEKIPAKPLSGNPPLPIDQSLFETISKIKNTLVDLGLTEVQTYSFFSTQVLNSLGWDKQPKLLVKVANPISKETEYMRMNLWPNLVEVISKNRDFEDVAIFEVGKIFNPVERDRPEEKQVLSIALSNGTDNPLAETYQVAQKVFEQINEGIKITQDKPLVEMPMFHPNRLLPVMYKGERIGALGEVHPRILDRFGIHKRVAVLEIQLDNLV